MGSSLVSPLTVRRQTPANSGKHRQTRSAVAVAVAVADQMQRGVATLWCFSPV